MTQEGYLLLGLTVIVGVLAAVVTFALLKAGAAARHASRGVVGSGENAFMQAALEEALATLKVQERAMTARAEASERLSSEITARAEASERLSSEIIASMTSGLMVVGSHGEVRILNPAARRLLGLPDVDFRGRNYREVLDSSPLAEVIEESLSGTEPIVRRALPLRSNTGASHLGVTVSRIFDGHGALSGVICLFTDLSAVVELEEQLRLKDSLARLGELTAGLAHEFRNGLATIHGYARLLDLDRLPAEYRSYVQGIRAEGDELGAIVTNFLNFARPVELTLMPVDMHVVAERAADDIRQEARARHGQVSVKGEFGTVLGDDVLLRQAISNLCRNALEACSEAEIAPRIVLEGAIDTTPRQLRLTVADNGPGIDPSLGDQIFRPFFTTRARGTGLGLALVQKIVVTHNGRVTVAANPIGGATFQVSLPLAHE